MNATMTDPVNAPVLPPLTQAAPPPLPPPPPPLSGARRDMGRRSLAAFAQIYFPHYCALPPSRMHRELYALLEDATARRNQRIAVAAPRGHAKTTLVTTIYLLWCVCHDRERFIVLIGDTAQQAANHLSKVKHELESNVLLQADFPEVCELPGIRPHPRRWRSDEIVTRNGVMVTALGVGQRIRGRSNRQDRPGLIILDDADSDEAANSPDRRMKLIDHFDRAILKAGTPSANVIVVGTILHYDTLLGRLVEQGRSPGWTTRVYRALSSWPERMDLWDRWESIYSGLVHDTTVHPDGSGTAAARAFYLAHRSEMDAGAVALWPAKEDLYCLMEVRLREGRAPFDAEKQNEPVNPADCVFREEDLHYWDEQGQTVEQLLAAVPGRLYAAIDPSLGKAGAKHSDSAIVCVLRADRDGRLYVLDADVRRRPPDQIIAAAVELQRRRNCVRFGVETVQFQDYLCDELARASRRHDVRLPLHRIRSTSDKHARIVSLQPLLTGGRLLLLSKRHRTLFDQLRRYPKAAQNDGPDALAMVVDLALSFRSPSVTFLDLRTGRISDPTAKDADEESWQEIFDRRGRRFRNW